MSRPQPGFWGLVCQFAPYLYMLLIVVTSLFVLNLIAMLLTEQSEASFTISLLNFGVLGVTGVSVGLVLHKCNQT